MFRVRSGDWSAVLRIAIAAFLLFSCARTVCPLLAYRANSSLQLHSDSGGKIGRGITLEVSNNRLKVSAPFLIGFGDSWLTSIAQEVARRAGMREPVIQIWPQHRRFLLRRLLSPTPDTSH